MAANAASAKCVRVDTTDDRLRGSRIAISALLMDLTFVLVGRVAERGGVSAALGYTADQLFLVTTVSRYSLGATNVPSWTVLNLSRRANRSASSASRASGSIAANTFTTGP